jgi:hypothetical protein
VGHATTILHSASAMSHAQSCIRWHQAGRGSCSQTCTSCTVKAVATNTCTVPKLLLVRLSALCCLGSAQAFRYWSSQAPPGVACCIPCAASAHPVVGWPSWLQAQLTPKPPLLILPVPSAAMLLTLLLAASTAALPSGRTLDACLLSWPAALLALLFWRVVGLDTAAGGGMLVTSSLCSP